MASLQPHDEAARLTQYEPLTLLMCVRLAAPHTWPGPSVLTSVFGGMYALAHAYGFDVCIWCLLLSTAVFAQSAVNTLNDWADWRSGTDTLENSDDPADAVLVYGNPNPTHVLALGIAYMAVALVCGSVCVAWSGSALPLLAGLFGAVIVVCYSSGRLPLSYLPVGELVSGVVMGCLIPVADVCTFAGHALGGGPFALLWQLDWVELPMATAPFVLGIALVMATQNICDIERDEPVGRRTLPVLLGRLASRIAYRVCVALWVACVLHLVFWSWRQGMWAALVTLVFGAGSLRAMLVCPLGHDERGTAMAAVGKANLFVNGAYVLAMIAVLVLS